MKVLILMSNLRTGAEIVERLSGDGVGIVFVGNGVYHAALKEGGRPSPLVSTNARLYVLLEDLESRGFSVGQLPADVKPVTYDDLVDLLFNEYEKTMWL